MAVKSFNLYQDCGESVVLAQLWSFDPMNCWPRCSLGGARTICLRSGDLPDAFPALAGSVSNDCSCLENKRLYLKGYFALLYRQITVLFLGDPIARMTTDQDKPIIDNQPGHIFRMNLPLAVNCSYGFIPKRLQVKALSLLADCKYTS
jgi:hypothetical protein